jgi:hypothetical protein
MAQLPLPLPLSTAEACRRGVITGVAQGAVLERVDIDDFMAGNDGDVRLNLFLLAQESLQSDHNFVNGWFSYFHICGIHGLPTVQWSDVSTKALYNFLERHARKETEAWDINQRPVAGIPKNGDQWKGYCTHNSVQFLPWHRYAALYFAIV